MQIAGAEIASRRRAVLAVIASLALIEVDAIVLARAEQPMPTKLGTLDAIHLASALLWREAAGENLTMATHDRALALAAQAHGLPIIGTAGL
jgi:predicted nucleic acid-binding protein